MATSRTLRVLSSFLAELHRLQEPADVLRTVSHWTRGVVPHDLMLPAFTERPTGAVVLPGAPPEFADGYGRHAAEDRSRLEHLRARHPGAVRLSDVVSSGALHRSSLWNELMRPQRIRHVMTTCLTETPHVVGVLKMARVDGPDFSERERDVMALAVPHVRLAYANAQAMAELGREARRLRIACDHTDRAIIILGAGGAVLFQNARAETLCRRYFEPVSRRGPFDRDRLPIELQRLLAPLTPRATFAGPDGALTVRIASLDGDDGEVLVSLEEGTAPITSSLTAREREVLDWVAEGKSNPEIGLILGISARTVQTHLEHVFTKLGVVSRAQAVAEGLRRRADR